MCLLIINTVDIFNTKMYWLVEGLKYDLQLFACQLNPFQHWDRRWGLFYVDSLESGNTDLVESTSNDSTMHCASEIFVSYFNFQMSCDFYILCILTTGIEILGFETRLREELGIHARNKPCNTAR